VAFAILLHALNSVIPLLWAGLFFVTGDLSLERIRAATHASDGKDERPAAPTEPG
jgi:hypothetical protein